MVMHVYDNAKQCAGLSQIAVATDNDRIAEVCRAYGADVIMTQECDSGTERVFSALNSLAADFDIVINVQGDEPLIQASHIQELINVFNSPNADIATLAETLTEEADNDDPNTVKLVFKDHEIVRDFTREPLTSDEKYKHIGLYAFRTSIIPELRKIEMSERRKKESLEQLDWLLQGYNIYARIIKGHLISVDTQKDLDKVRKLKES